MNKLGKLEKKFRPNYVMRTGGTSFETYLFGQMVYHYHAVSVYTGWARKVNPY